MFTIDLKKRDKKNTGKQGVVLRGDLLKYEFFMKHFLIWYSTLV